MKPFAKAFYRSPTWRRCRDGYFSAHNGICEVCGAPGEEVHHKIFLTPANINNPEITLNWDNLQLLCKDCHFKAHNKKQYLKRPVSHEARRYSFGEDGSVIENNKAMIVWGAPASGKNRYIKEHWHDGDIIVDLDRIIQSLIGCDSKTQDVSWVLPLALDIRKAVYCMIASKQYEIQTAWVVAMLPKKQERADLARQLNAQLIHIDTDMQTCLDRVMADGSRQDKERQREIVLKYFERVEL